MKGLGALLPAKLPRLSKLPRISLPRLQPPRLARPRITGGDPVAVTVAGDGLRLTAMKGNEVIFWQHMPVPAGLLRDGWIADPEAFGLALRETLRQCALPMGRLFWSLPGTMSMARLLSIRLAGVADPASTIAHEAAWAMPVTPEDHYLYWQPLEGYPSEHIFALAVRKDAIDDLLRACAIAKARPVVVDLKPLALVLAVGQQEAVIADAEPTSIDVLIVSQGLPVVMRSTHLGDQPLDVSYVRAKLVEELDIAMQLYNDTNPDAPLEPAIPIYLTGDLCDAALASQVAAATRHPTVEPETPFTCPPGFPAGRYMTNLGLLLKRG